MSQQIKIAKKDLSSLLARSENLTLEEIESYFSKNSWLVDDIDLISREKMAGDIALLLTLSEQKRLSL